LEDGGTTQLVNASVISDFGIKLTFDGVISPGQPDPRDFTAVVGSTSVNVTDAIIDSTCTMCVKLTLGASSSLYDKYVIISYNEFGSAKKSNANIIVNVLDVAETPVIDFGSDGLNFTVSENAAASSYVSEPLMKYTSDEDHGSSYTYSITDTNRLGMFFIHPKDGRIGVVARNSNLNFEKISSYGITIRATDNEGLYAEISTHVLVIDENENHGLHHIII
jgi:hypothetical protein